MTDSPDDALTEIRRTLDSWHATHPDATFLEMEDAVEAQLHQLRASLLAEQTERTFVPEHPVCRECGAQMEPRTQRDRHVVLGGDETVDLQRSYAVCPSCGAGLFPPG
jgi:YgiT-type zinc finger domain-containing protein